MAAPMEIEVLRVSLFSRLLVFVCQFIFNILIPDHNADVFNPPTQRNEEANPDKVVNILAAGYVRWDSVYFLHIAEHGYIYENSLAFFPLFPWTIRLVANSVFLPLQLCLQYRSVLILSGICLNFVIFIKTTVIIFRLTKILFKSEHFANLTAILFCFNPASIFMSALYSESLFAFLSFSAMLAFEEGQSQSVIYSSLSCLTRSNGVISAGFELHKSAKEIVGDVFVDGFNISKILRVIKRLCYVIAFVIFLLAPFILYQVYISDIFCNRNYHWTIPKMLLSYGKERHYNIVNHSDFVWCQNFIPLSYSSVQSRHWDVGFLRYYEFKQIPNFMLAMPVIFLSTSSISYFYHNNRKCCQTLGLLNSELDTKKDGCRFSNSRLLPYVVYLLFVTVFGIGFIHIQVLTRMIFSSSPVVYWFAAEVIMGTRKHTECDILQKLKYFKNQNLKTKAIIIYFLSYFVIGTFMFSNFLPWT